MTKQQMEAHVKDLHEILNTKGIHLFADENKIWLVETDPEWGLALCAGNLDFIGADEFNTKRVDYEH